MWNSSKSLIVLGIECPTQNWLKYILLNAIPKIATNSGLISEEIQPASMVYDNIDCLEETLSGTGTTHRVNWVVIRKAFIELKLPQNFIDILKSKQRSIYVEPFIMWELDQSLQYYQIWMSIWILLMMMMSCFCGMVDRRKEFSHMSSRDHCQRYSPSQIFDKTRSGFEPAQNLSSSFVEWKCAVVITTTTRRHRMSCRKNFICFLCRNFNK